MGLFDFPFPLFERLDRFLEGSLLPVGRLVVWTVAASIITMALYRLFSNQKRLAHLKAESARARRDLARYDDNFQGLIALIARLLKLSAKQVCLTAGPAIVASLPLLSLVAWLSTAYDHALPKSGSIIEVLILPTDQEARWAPEAEAVGSRGRWRITWPGPGETVRLLDNLGHKIVSLPLRAPVPIIRKRVWWNAILGNPAGYIPQDVAIERIEFALPEIRVIDFGPNWLRSWKAAFAIGLVICSLGIKISFRIA